MERPYDAESSSVRVIPCESWDDFISKIRKPHFVGTRIFRGHADATWKLSSVWERIVHQGRENGHGGNARNQIPSIDCYKRESADRQRIVEVGGSVGRHLIARGMSAATVSSRGVQVSVTRSVVCRASASGRGRRGMPSASHDRYPPPVADTDPDASSPPGTTDSAP